MHFNDENASQVILHHLKWLFAMQCDLSLYRNFEPKIRDFGTIDWFRELALDQKRHRKLKENTKDKSATFVTNIKGNVWPIRILRFNTSKSGNWFKNLICSNCRFLQFSQICIIKLSSIIYGVWFNSLWSCGFFSFRGALACSDSFRINTSCGRGLKFNTRDSNKRSNSSIL